jgi:hypothetical protein
MENRQIEPESQQRNERASVPERVPSPQASVWDALEEIGRERGTSQEQSVSNNAMARVQERSTEQQRERETIEAERQRLEHKKQEREQERDFGLELGF